MTYFSANGTLVVSDCPGAAPTATGAFGDDASASGTGTSKVTILQQQLNRFVNVASDGTYPIYSTPLPVTGVLDANTLVRLQTVVLRRANAGAFNNLPDALREILTNAYVLTDAVYVAAHLDDAITLVSGYADSKGLPGSTSGIMASLAKLPTGAKVGIAAAVGWFIFLRKPGRGL